MKMTCTETVTLKTKYGPKVFKPGETFEVDINKARPYIEMGLLKPIEIGRDRTRKKLDPMEALDDFWAQEILPSLSRLDQAGRLPDLSTCSLWQAVDELWGRPCPDTESVKAAMLRAVEAYQRWKCLV